MNKLCVLQVGGLCGGAQQWELCSVGVQLGAARGGFARGRGREGRTNEAPRVAPGRPGTDARRAPPICRAQDDVPPFPDEVAFAIIESELGRPLGEVFSSISERPVAAASLGQVGARARIGVFVRRPGAWGPAPQERGAAPGRRNERRRHLPRSRPEQPRGRQAARSSGAQ